MTFSRRALDLDVELESERVQDFLIQSVRRTLRRNGAVVGISGGIDSSVVLALCVNAFGPSRVRAVIMPEQDSDPASERLARDLAKHFGVEPVVENLTAALHALGCYRRRDAAIQHVFPEYDPAEGYRAKITLPPNLLDADTLNVFSVTILTPDGGTLSRPLPVQEFRDIVAASNFKQRTRMATLYWHAEHANYAVAGTANKNEHDMGFFVKYGDGGVDVMPILHLYKTQVFQLGRHLGVPSEILERTPTTDTYSAPATQEEFFFRLPFETLDLLWYAQEQSVPMRDVAEVMGLSAEQVTRAYLDFESKHRGTEALRMSPLSLKSSQKARVGAAPAEPQLVAG